MNHTQSKAPPGGSTSHRSIRFDQPEMRGGSERVIRKEAKQQPEGDNIRVAFPVVLNPKPKALILHCSDVRFSRAFRNFIEGEAENCLGYSDEEYVSLIIPGGVSSFSEALRLPKSFKVAKDQIEYLLDHFNTIEQVILINHEDCGAYHALSKTVGSMFLKRFSALLERQKIDLAEVAKTVMGLKSFKATVRLYMAKFSNPEHTQVEFEEITP